MGLNIYNGNNGLKNGFKPAGGHVICGVAQNEYAKGGETAQASIGAIDPTTLLACVGVGVKNDDVAGVTGSGVIDGLNIKNFLVDKVVAATTDTLDGFVLESSNEVVGTDGDVGVPLDGGFVNLGLIGSGLEVFLPCDDTLIGVNLSQAVKYDVTNQCLTTGEGIALNVKLLSSVVKGQVKKITDGIVDWVDTSCILVRL